MSNWGNIWRISCMLHHAEFLFWKKVRVFIHTFCNSRLQSPPSKLSDGGSWGPFTPTAVSVMFCPTQYPFWVRCNHETVQLWAVCHVNTSQISRHPWVKITWTLKDCVFINGKKGSGDRVYSAVAHLYHNFIHVLILLDRLCATLTVTFRSLSKRNKQS